MICCFHSFYYQGDDYVRDMWNYICPELFKSLQTEMEPDILAVVMESVASCVEVRIRIYLDTSILYNFIY